MSNMLAMCLTFVNIVTCMNSLHKHTDFIQCTCFVSWDSFRDFDSYNFFFSCNGKCENRIFKYLLNAQYTTETILLLPLHTIARAHCVCHHLHIYPWIICHFVCAFEMRKTMHIWLCVCVWVCTTTFWKRLSSSYSKHIKLCETYLCINKLSQLHPHTIVVCVCKWFVPMQIQR